MSFFFKPLKPSKPSPQELAKLIRESFIALDDNAVVEARALEKALEEVQKHVLSMKQMLSGDNETEPNPDHILQLTLEICKEDVLSLFVHKLPMLGWEARKDIVHCWCILLKQTVGSSCCCVDYIESHSDLLDFLVVCYNNKDIALSCGHLLRECIKYSTLTRYLLESASLELFFKYVELPNFDIASDALSTFKDLLTKHDTLVSQFFTEHFDQFFGLYDKLLRSANYVTRRQSLKILLDILLEPPNAHVMKRYILQPEYLETMMTLLKDSSKNIQMSAFHIFKVFVANPNKSPEIISILARNHEMLLKLLQNLPAGKGEDEQFEEEKDLIIKEIKDLAQSQM